MWWRRRVLNLMPFRCGVLKVPAGGRGKSMPARFCGGPSRGDRVRTCDVRFWRPVLYQLELRPYVELWVKAERPPSLCGRRPLRCALWLQALVGASPGAGLLGCSMVTRRVDPNA